MTRLRNVALGICLLTPFTAACSRNPVDWGPVRYLDGDSSGTPGSLAAAPTSATTSPANSICNASVRSAAVDHRSFSAWWSVRGDSSAILEFSRKSPGAPEQLVIVDSSDKGGSGCRRPAPALFADSSNGYVHLAYFIEPAAGAGIFVIHSMDTGTSFHSPVAVAFGGRPSATAVSADGDRVAVAYLQPMGERSQVFVALSTTAGHIFESGIPVSEENADARNPRVTLRGTKLEVSWTERARGASPPDRSASRTGVWK